ncbi:MAG TPA: L,D-transpeptidase [Longimicrobium sp.]|nr:L,D-transpeptidase [Longimicrobium sp.]
MSWTLSLAVAAALAANPPCAPAPGAPMDSTAARADSGLSLRLNLPAFRVDLRDGAGLVRSYTVAIGSRRYRTPTGRYHVSSVQLNPWWHPPDSPWARKEKVTPPGPDNPMGKAKLNFHELYFLHGTPLEESLGSAASHGCVRMASGDALDLARRVLAFARPDVGATEIDALAASRRTRHYGLRVTVPLEIVYRTAEVREGALELHPDVYRRESTTLRVRALDALRQAGVAEDRLDPARLDSAVRAARREHVRVELDRLLRSEDPDAAAADTLSWPAPPAAARSGGRRDRRAAARTHTSGSR